MQLTDRTCSRCGVGFSGGATAYVCVPCHKPRTIGRDISKPLTVREKQVVTLVRKAMANKEIAWELKLTEGTVKEYLFVIFKKAGVKNRTELALWAMSGEGKA